MMKSFKKVQVFMLALILALGVAAPSVFAAAPKLNKTKVTLTVGKSITLKLNNAPKGKKITWSSSDKEIAAVSGKGKVTAKKAGTATITAKIAKKKYNCKVTIKNKPEDQPSSAPGSDIVFYHENGKNKADVKALEAVIREQNGKYGAKMPVDLDDKKHYSWKNERLYRFSYLALGDTAAEKPPLKGKLDLTPFSELTVVQCLYNELTGLNVQGLKKLERLECNHGTLTGLDLGTNAALKKLYCGDNRITKLDVSANTALETLSCAKNQLTALDLGGLANLQTLYCQENQSLSAVRLNGCTSLNTIWAKGCAITSLDLSATKIAADSGNNILQLDEGVQVTYPSKGK